MYVRVCGLQQILIWIIHRMPKEEEICECRFADHPHHRLSGAIHQSSDLSRVTGDHMKKTLWRQTTYLILVCVIGGAF
jgi:hypothetical protein